MSWQPCASLKQLKARAKLNTYIRDFFALREVLEVETPILSRAAVSDVNLKPVTARCCDRQMYLHTSPEYPMKRLLAAGSGDIYQICKVFRDEEQGRKHNPEFTMLEYYRIGMTFSGLMDEVAQLVGGALNIQARIDISYRRVFKQYLGIDPLTHATQPLVAMAKSEMNSEMPLDREASLDILMTHCIEPKLPKNTLVFISGYPGAQAALAKTYESSDGHVVANRFELYVNGIELANGYDELTDIDEQRTRFDQDQSQHQREFPQDAYFLEALNAGLPNCVGVAIGLDRVLMLKQKQDDIQSVISFDIARA